MKLPLALVGIVVGTVLLEWPGVFVGCAVGLLWGELLDLKGHVRQLENRIAAAVSPEATADSFTPRAQAALAFSAGVEAAADSLPLEEVPAQDVVKAAHLESEPGIDHSTVAAEREYPHHAASAANEKTIAGAGIDRLAGYMRTFFTTGNVVVKVGVIILFFGVAFLLKYAVDRNAMPIEFRLVGAALGALVLLVIGWRLRLRRAGYALILQGGAIGILYMTVFVAAKIYWLVPPVLALVVMVALVALCGGLAVLQDSMALACFGATGGFLAPVLTSTGGGSHVMLFSYYALLNAGIFGVAWFKSWRILNLLGFVFTFGIGSLWGLQYYRPPYFNTTEPFLVLFFLFYVSNAVLFAHRQPPQFRGYVDSSLVFGVPLVGFAMQSGLVKNFEYGMAISAITMSGFYIALAWGLWQRRVEGMRLLTEAFLALGVVFGSMAIPLALNGKWTAVSWAFEGAALVWIGVRQDRLRARLFGLLLQAGAGFSFLISFDGPAPAVPILNGVYPVCFIISLTGLFSSYYLYRHPTILRDWEKDFHLPVLVWGLLWWFGGGLHEIHTQVNTGDRLNAALLFMAGSFLSVSLVARRFAWQVISYSPILLLPLLILAAPFIYFFSGHHPFYRWGALAWIAAFAAQYRLLWNFEEGWPESLVRWWQVGTLWLLVAILSWEAAWSAGRMVDGAATWKFIQFGIVPGIFVYTIVAWRRKIGWPVTQFQESYDGCALPFLSLWLWLWGLIACCHAGDPAPLSYLPVLNPLDVVQLFVLLVLTKWAWKAHRDRLAANLGLPDQLINALLGLAVFAWLNGLVARTVHYWCGVPFNLSALLNSDTYQAAVAILWSLVALGLMVAAARRINRPAWKIGAGLLGLVVVKLFFVDLAGSGTIARIISFLVVGVLMLLIGYFSPIPPHASEEAAS